MRFRRLDLNLLVALEVLLDECNVTRAAERMNLSQAAMSNALNRLREHFNDDLLMRVGRRMVMTDRARVIQSEVSEVLRRIETRVLVAPEFDPLAQTREVAVMTSDAVSVGFLAYAGRELAQQAPGITLKVRPILEQPWHLLDRGEMDLLLIPRQFSSTDHPLVPLYDEPFAAVVWRDGPYAAGMDADDYMDGEHVVIELGPERKTPVDRAIIEQSHGRLRRGIVVSSQAMVPWQVVGTNRIGTVPLHLARQFADVLPLVIHPLPFDVPPNQLVAQWSRYATDDMCIQWLGARMQQWSADAFPSV